MMRVWALSSKRLFVVDGVIRAILLMMCSYICTAKKLPIYRSLGVMFSRNVRWQITSFSCLQSSKLFMMMLIRRWSLLASSMQLCLILWSSTTKVRTSALSSIPRGRRKKSYTRLLPTWFRTFSLMLGYCSLGLKRILKLVTMTVPWREEGTDRKLCSQVTLVTTRYFSSPISTSCSKRP